MESPPAIAASTNRIPPPNPSVESYPDLPEALSAKSLHSPDTKEPKEKRSHVGLGEKQPFQQQPREPKADDNQISPEGSSNPTPDVRYVLSGQPTGWAAMAETVRAYDEEKVKDTKEDVDTLLVFAGLFSAVLTAFLVESYQKLSPDTSSQMLAVMQQIALQTASYNVVNGMINATAQPPSEITSIASQPFTPSSSDICVNILWFASLIFSLITASFGMLVKQWLREYLAVENPSPQARLRIRRFRYPELMRWNVFEIAAILPLLQQMALALFFIGLCYFTQSVHESVGHTSLPLVSGWAFCFSTVTILPMFFPRCPYKTTLLKHLLQSIHMHSVQAMRNMTLPVSIWHQHGDYESWRDRAFRWTLSFIMKIDDHVSRSSEEKAVVAERADLSILVDVDALQSNDELLGSTILESLHQIQPEWDNVVDFVLRVLEHRLQRGDLATGEPTPLDLRTLSRPGRTAIIDILSYYSSSAISQYVQSDQAIARWERSKQTMFAFFIFFSPARYTLPKTGITVLNEVLQHKGTALIELLARSCPLPVDLSEDKFYLLVSGLMNVLEDLDVNLTLSLQYFETLMNVRFREANAAQVDANFPDGSFAAQEDLEAWPWSQAMIPDARTDAARLLISTMHRALGHMKRSTHKSVSQVLSRSRAPAAIALRPPPSRLVDGIVGMWNMAYVAKINEYSHTQELKFRAAIEECLTMKETTFALLKSLGQIKSGILVHCQTRWRAFPCGPWLLFEDAQHKLNNLIDAMNDLAVHTATTVTPTAHLLTICYVVLHMIELPDAIGFGDQWASLCRALTHFGREPLQRLGSPEPFIDDSDEATPTARLFNAPAKPPTHSTPPPPPLDSINDGIIPRFNQSHHDAMAECQMLAECCLGLVQKHDIQVLVQSEDYEFDENPLLEIDDSAYEDWLARFGEVDSVIDDEFVEMLGRIYGDGSYVPLDWRRPNIPFFRLKKMGMGNGFVGQLAHTVIVPGSGDDLTSVSEPNADDVADPDNGEEEVCEVLSIDDLKFERGDEKSQSSR